MILPFAAFSASCALVMAWAAEPLASVMPVWAFWLTSSSLTSVRFTRSWVFSTSVERESTFWLTSPTSRDTYFLVAQPVATRLARSTGRMIALTRDLHFECMAMLRRRGHVSATGPDLDALAGGPHLDAAEAGRSRKGLVPDPVLVLQLIDDLGGGLPQPGEVAHREGGAS